MNGAAGALDGKVAVVTGGNSGIGKETVVALAGMGSQVVIAARNAAKAAAALDEVRQRTGTGDRVDTMPLDLASFAAVQAFSRAFHDRHDRLDILVNNAGIILRKREVTVDGHELQFQVNHLSHFLLTALLHDRLVGGATARVVVVASEAHKAARKGLDFDDLEWERRRYGLGFGTYAATKLANILFTRELARRLEGTGVTANAVHPGFVASNFAREGDTGPIGNLAMVLGRPFAKSPEQGAQTSIHVASSPSVEGVSGQYFARCKIAIPARQALDDGAAARLWEISEKLTA
jgi:NAD(P)-dependent dehydrogenase (short-subunit alcohol dehydrogenase family)